MVTEHIVGRPIPLSLDLSLLSERVLIAISRKKLTPEDKDVLSKAAQFLQEVQRGGDAVRSLELGATTSREIQSFSLAMSAYNYKKAKQRARVVQAKIAKLLVIANQLAQAEALPSQSEEIDEFRTFFETTKRITRQTHIY